MRGESVYRIRGLLESDLSMALEYPIVQQEWARDVKS